MNVKDVMVTDVSACRPESNLAEAAASMWISRCAELPVVDGSGHVLSLITNQDICAAKDSRNMRALEIHVKDVSLPRVLSCEADDDVQLALKTMVSQNVPRIPVVDHDRKLAGMLSIGDLLEQSEGRPNQLGISHEQVVNAATSIQKDDSTRAREHTRAAHRTGLLRTICNLVLGPVTGDAERIQPLGNSPRCAARYTVALRHLTQPSAS